MENAMGHHPRFAEAVVALDAGDAAALHTLLARAPELVHARASSSEPPYDGYFHGATLLHHLAGNPIRGPLPPNAVELATLLLTRGAEVDATCGGGPAQPSSGGGTVLGLLASGMQAHRQGLTEPLLDCLLARGANLDSRGDGGLMWTTLYHIVEHRGQREVAQMLRHRGHDADLCFAAGLGESASVVQGVASGLVPGQADRLYRHHRRSGVELTPADLLQDLLLFATIGGHADLVGSLIDHGAAVDLPRPWAGETVTPLHGAAWAGWPNIVQCLLDRGADPTSTDSRHGATPLEWSIHCKRPEAYAILAAAGRAGGRRNDKT